MIELHQLPAAWNLPSLSPFCLKVETYLRMRQIPYRSVVEHNPGIAPKKKLPFLVDGSQTIADSSFIIDYLEEKYGPMVPMRKEPAIRAFQKMIEESLYFVILYSRWVDPSGWPTTTQDFADLFPPVIGPAFMRYLRHQLTRQAMTQGIGRHNNDEIYELGNRDLEAVCQFLGNKRFFNGNQPTPIDATVYAFTQTILKSPVGERLRQTITSYPNMLQYCDQMEHEYFFERKQVQNESDLSVKVPLRRALLI